MNNIKELKNNYWAVDAGYAAKEFRARARGQTVAENRWKNHRDRHTLAIFLFLFTRLEGHINREVKTLIDEKKSALTTWRSKAVWENHPTKTRGIPFLNRVALLVDRTSPEYELIIGYYDIRNTIGHGGVPAALPINMIQAFSDVERLIRTI